LLPMTSVCWCAGDTAAVLTISTAHIATNIRAAFQMRPWHMFNMIAASAQTQLTFRTRSIILVLNVLHPLLRGMPVPAEVAAFLRF